MYAILLSSSYLSFYIFQAQREGTYFLIKRQRMRTLGLGKYKDKEEDSFSLSLSLRSHATSVTACVQRKEKREKGNEW